MQTRKSYMPSRFKCNYKNYMDTEKRKPMKYHIETAMFSCGERYNQNIPLRLYISVIRMWQSGVSSVLSFQQHPPALSVEDHCSRTAA